MLNDKWTLLRLLGIGGMAAVYAGRHRNGAKGAVKLLHPELARSPEVRERFLREGYAANRVEHPGAVQVLDDDVVQSGPDVGTAYLIMELLDGESLEDRIRRRPGRFAEAEALAIAEGVLDVLIAAHANGVIHRDIKPENIFLATGETEGEFGFERVKLLDFGLARIAHGDLVTQSGMALGTPSFMAPEQAEGRAEEIDGRTDLFAVGANLYRMLTAQKIHEAPNVLELVMKMAKIPAPPIRSVRDDLSASMATIVDRALRFRREDRYADAAAMRADVRAARGGLALPSELGTAVTMINVPSLGRADESGSLPARAKEPEREPSAPLAPMVEASEARPPRSNAFAIVVLLLVLAAGGFGVSRYVGHSGDHRATTSESSASASAAPSSENSAAPSSSLVEPAAVPTPSIDPVPSTTASASATGEVIELGDADIESSDADVSDASSDAPTAAASTPPVVKPVYKPKYTKPTAHPKKKKK